MHENNEITNGITSGVEARKQRGLEIAALARIDKKDGVYIVPSQYNPRSTKYKVNYDAENPTCNCADHETRQCKCKHIYAVEYFIKREQNADGSTEVTETLTVTKTRKTYAQDWPAYNEAQVNEKRQFQRLLFDLCKDLPALPVVERKGPQGRRPIPASDGIFAAVYKVYCTLSARRFISDLCEAQNKGYVSKVPHFNTVLNYLEHPGLFPLLTDLITRASLPLRSVERDFAVDSTGFTACRFVRWFDIKYNRFTSEQQWVKAHLATGVKTNVVTAIEIHSRDSGDAQHLPSLVASTAKNFKIAEVSADKGYSGREQHDAIAAVGATPYIAFKANTTGGVGGLFEKMFHYFQFNKEDFLNHYHKRSNVESTVMMIKSKFGDAVRSKTETAARNEVLAKVLCHNICCNISAIYELGIQPIFCKSTEEAGNIPPTI